MKFKRKLAEEATRSYVAYQANQSNPNIFGESQKLGRGVGNIGLDPFRLIPLRRQLNRFIKRERKKADITPAKSRISADEFGPGTTLKELIDLVLKKLNRKKKKKK